MASSSSGVSAGQQNQAQSLQSRPQAQTQGEFSGTSNVTKPVCKAIAQYPTDTRLHATFEQSEDSGKPFNYSESVRAETNYIPEEQIVAYLSKIQRGGLVQSFGCLVAVNNSDFRVIAFSENAREMLCGAPPSVPGTDIVDIIKIGIDVRKLFVPRGAVTFEKLFRAREISLLNPVWMYSKSSKKPFYAIFHRIDVGILIDFEPATAEDPSLSIAAAVQSQKLAVRSISHLQSLPGGDIKLLCDTVVQKVKQFTGYDRVMVYKFHEDEHGEVVAERTRPDLESYLGLHYPATDVPQASRYLFQQNRVRMIADCIATPVPIVQDEALKQPLCLVSSTLRAPHGCHAQYMANMGSNASLVMAVLVNANKEDPIRGRNSSTRLWGLLVCHHTSARSIPFPLRYACEFLMQAFGLQLNMELKLASQMSEKRVLRTQTLLCDMLLRDSHSGIVTQSPNIMDLVKCDGAALYCNGIYYPLGVAPTQVQIKDIVEWLLASHGDSTGLSTDSLVEAGYPGGASLGDAVCGMAVAYITTSDFSFWFRSHTAKEIKWGGAKHHPEDKDDGKVMHPRSSVKVFLEVVKGRSLPWDDAELDAIHSLRAILRDSFKDAKGSSKNIAFAHGGDTDIQTINELSSLTREMVRLIETATAPIFAIDIKGCINGWNAKIAELTGLSVEEAMGKSLVHDLVFEESEETVQKLLSNALRAEEKKNIEIKLRTFGLEQDNNAVFVVVNACCSKDYTNNIVGVCFIGQDVTVQKVVMDKFINIQGDYKAIVHSPHPLIPPIFASDENTCCSEWNSAMEKLTGLNRGDIIGKMLVGEIFGGCCKLKGPDSLTKLMIILHNAIAGQETDKFSFTFIDQRRKYVEALLTANTRVNIEGQTIGAFCFLQIASPELQQVSEVQSKQENRRMKELAYICQELRNPLSGLCFTNSLLEVTDLTEDQKQFVKTSSACEKQMTKILKDVSLEHIDESSLEFEKGDFLLGSVIDAVVSQIMLLLRERGLQLIRNIPEEIKTLRVYGDQIRVQQVLGDFLLNMVRHASSSQGWVQIQVQPTLKHICNGITTLRTEFRIVCPGEGLPPELIEDMFKSSQWVAQEGLGLSLSRKILKLLNGDVQYIRESERCYFHIIIELPTSQDCSGTEG